AAMLELDPTRFRDMFDEMIKIPETIRLDLVLTDAQQLARDREPDPDFLQGFAAYVRVERSSEPVDERTRAARAGVRALARFLDRNPLHAGALTLRALLAPLAGLP